MPPKSAAATGMSAEERAQDNPELFIKECFADAPEKSPYTTLLCGLNEVTKAALQAAAATVPGLDVKFFPANDALAIGWGKKDVWNGTSPAGGAAANGVAKGRGRPKTGAAAEGTPTGKTRGRPRKTEAPVKAATGGKRKAAAAAAPGPSKRQKKSPAGSIVGMYDVKCPGLEEEWPSDCEDGLTLDIGKTDQDGVYVGRFDFGIIEGVMLISTDKGAISRYSRQIDQENSHHRDRYGMEDEDEDEDGDEDEDDEAPATGAAKSGKKGAKAMAAAQAEAPPSLRYHVCLRGRETGEGQIQSDSWGEIKFSNATLKKFAGQITISFAGACKLTGTKTSTGDPAISPAKWAEYSEEQYEYERVNRWGGSRW
ncbi:hypothetical protein RB595_000225 [Gaeumannomyces hyphopodioides]